MANRVQISQEVPIFLRKTYHMIDTCDSSIAGWSEDGETFVVKNPDVFEKKIIPQFFKHSKFSSFVRQLNFYSFRKIKFSDSIRIDPEVEKETSNFWRFRHENFRRGRPDLLTQIKRSPSTKAAAAASKVIEKVEVDKNTKMEVTMLKKRVEEMSKTIDELSSLVQQVNIKQEEHENNAALPVQNDVPLGTKRVKLEQELARPDMMLSSPQMAQISLPPMNIPPPVPLGTRETTVDSEFVEDLLSAFEDEPTDMFLDPPPVPEPVVPDQPMSEPAVPVAASPTVQALDNPNRPDAELMSRLGDALSLLPKEIQTLIVDRLIASIMCPGVLDNPSTSVDSNFVVEPKKIAAAGKALPTELATEEKEQKPRSIPPLAAATLAALLHHYTTQSETPKKPVQHNIPVVPVNG